MAAKTNQVEKILVQISEIKDKLENAKVILKDFKVKSDRLTQLKKAKKELAEQIEEEIDRIEGEYYEDKDYEQSKNDELTYKNQLKEKSSELREAMAKVDVSQQLSIYEYNIKGEPVKMQVERVVKVYLNGREQK